MSTFDQILEVVRKSCTHSEPVVDENATPKAIKISKEDLTAVAEELLQNPLTYFDMLSCITGLDNGPDAGRMEVIYNVYSIPLNHHLMVKITIPRDALEVETVSHIWKTAEWHEREIFDMYGIYFMNHKDLRRILMPADWEGHPLRKDYKHQEYYRDIKVQF